MDKLHVHIWCLYKASEGDRKHACITNYRDTYNLYELLLYLNNTI